MNRLKIWPTGESPGELRKDTDFPDLIFRDSDLFKVEIKNEYFFSLKKPPAFQIIFMRPDLI